MSSLYSTNNQNYGRYDCNVAQSIARKILYLAVGTDVVLEFYCLLMQIFLEFDVSGLLYVD